MNEIAKKPRQSSEDRISALPDSVVHHILSFLVLKQVIATSVLSTRWRFLWTSVPNLDLGKWTCYNEDEAGFYDIPTSISLSLMLYDCPKIRKFRAHFYWSDVSLRHRHLDSWIRLAVKRHVQELDLSLYNRDYKEYYSRFESLKLYQVHGCLFHCGSLEVLRLRYCKLNLPSPLSLCLLKKLQLHHVWLSDLDTSGCPALECLILRNCHSWGHLNIYAPNQKLTHLKIYDTWAVGELESESALTLFAPNLLSIQFSGHIRHAYNIKNLTSLKSASLNDVFEDDTRKVYEYSVQLVELLVSVSHASTLLLGPWWIEISLPPIRATCLVLETTMNKSELLGMASVLRSSQHLESLILLMTKAHLFHDVDEACHDVVENWGPLERSLSTTHQLKIVKINNFLQVHKSFWQQTRGAQPIRDVDKFLVDGWGKIIMLVKLLLNNCIVLGKLTVGIVKIPHPQRFELLFGLTKMFLSFRRASVNAEVDVLESASSSKCRDIFLLESNICL